MAVSSLPAVADADQNLKQEVEKLASTYVENFNRQDAAGIAALYASGGMLVDTTGPHPDIAEFYSRLFKAGIDHDELTVDQVSPLGNDAVLAWGEFRVSGKSQSGAPVEVKGFWTEVAVREGGKLKVRLLTAFRKAPPPKD
jgi:ketosteroid isomerase-like protein